METVPILAPGVKYAMVQHQSSLLGRRAALCMHQLRRAELHQADKFKSRCRHAADRTGTRGIRKSISESQGTVIGRKQVVRFDVCGGGEVRGS